MISLTPKHIVDTLKHECRLEKPNTLLVAVSGGADSMALLYLLNQTNWPIEAAHCNFQLRGDESEADQLMVENYCKEQAIKLHTVRFETTNYAKENKVSIEMAARELRYSWFDQLIKEKGFEAVLTGHHGNDSIETFFLNLVRGTGVKGLSGIQYRNGNVARPLLTFSRERIIKYCAINNVPYRNDSSNSDTKFLRNKIRHEIIPVLEQMNPLFFHTMLNNMEHLNEAQYLLDKEVKRFKDEVLVEEHGRVLVPISKLNLYNEKKTILFEVLRPYGFNPSIVNDVIGVLDGISGKQFFSDTHRLIKDRHNLMVMANEDVGVDHFWVEPGITDSPMKLEVKVYPKTDEFKFSSDPFLVHIDADLVDVPLLFRKWKVGDYFMPLGMSQFKKVSDFFIDNKFSLDEKEEAWLAVSGEDIVWIAGHRIDERYKITKRTKNILEINVIR